MLSKTSLKIKLTGYFLFCILCSSQLRAFERFEFDFEEGHNGWTGDFTDYPAGNNELFYELTWGWTSLPVAIETQDKKLSKGMFLSGNNHSDDLFMFIKRPILGLQPNAEYDLHFMVTIEADIPTGLYGVGGSPGESVYFKVGASTMRPEKINVRGQYRLNVDKGNQSMGGKNATVVGTMENPLVDPSKPQFKSKIFINEIALTGKSDAEGRLWLFVGTDSGYEATTRYYIAKISVIVNQKK